MHVGREHNPSETTSLGVLRYGNEFMAMFAAGARRFETIAGPQVKLGPGTT